MSLLSKILQVIVEHFKKPVITIHPTTYSLTVDYTVRIEEIIRRGQYSWSNNHITTEHFPPANTHQDKKEIEVVFLHCDRNISTDEVIRHADSLGYRTIQSHETVSFGAQYPDVQKKFAIIGLGSIWKDSVSGETRGDAVICLRSDGELRGLSLSYCNNREWGPYCYFGITPK